MDIVAGTIDSCSVLECDTVGYSFVGGLVGWNDGDIINCSVEGGSCTGDEFIGGLAGRNNWVLENCRVSAVFVKGSFCVGALAGGNYGEIRTSTVYDDVILRGKSQLGAFAGYNFMEPEVIFSCDNQSEYPDIGNGPISFSIDGVEYSCQENSYWEQWIWSWFPCPCCYHYTDWTLKDWNVATCPECRLTFVLLTESGEVPSEIIESRFVYFTLATLINYNKKIANLGTG